jgi:putative membrane protein
MNPQNLVKSAISIVISDIRYLNQEFIILLWVKAFHIIAMVCWFAGLFYLPRLFVYHAQATDDISKERFIIMERRLYYGIMTPAAVITLLLGLWLLSANPAYYLISRWMQIKLVLVSLLVVYHLYCGHLKNVFKQNNNSYTHRFYRWLNEIPTILLIVIVILVTVRPF